MKCEKTETHCETGIVHRQGDQTHKICIDTNSVYCCGTDVSVLTLAHLCYITVSAYSASM